MEKNGVQCCLCMLVVGATIILAGCKQERLERSPQASARQEMNLAYDRIMQSGTIRAGYVVYPPGCYVDKTNGQVRGIFPDILRAIAKNAGLKVEFAEEVGFGTMIEGLETQRYDILGSPTWANTLRAKTTMMSAPVHFTAIGVWVRPSETRFSATNNWSDINASSVRVPAMDGSIPLAIAKAQFPKCTLVTYPDIAGTSQLLLDVAQGKADVLFTEPEKGLEFLTTHPGALINIAQEHPLRVYPCVFMSRKNEPQLKNIIDIGILELQNSGEIDRILREYEPYPNVYPRVSSGFKAQ